MKHLYDEIEEIMRQAGEMMLSAHLTKDEVFEKEGLSNFVTVYDKRVQEFLISKFQVLLPEASYFGEEETEGNRHGNVDEGYLFIIDPIDGTTNFLFDQTHSCVSVGLAFEGTIIAGFVYDPYSRRMYKGIRGEGAFLNDRRVKMEDKGLAEGIAEFGCVRYNDDRLDLMMAIVKELFLRSIGIRDGGAGAIGISKAGTGANVLYIELMLQPYDYAAASVIVEEAGGRICQANGGKITLDKGCSIVAGTCKAVEETLQLIKGLEQRI